MTTTDAARIQDIAARIRQEILDLIADGRLPEGVTTYTGMYRSIGDRADDLGGLATDNSDVDGVDAIKIKIMVERWMAARRNPVQARFFRSLTDQEIRRDVLTVNLPPDASGHAAYLRFSDVPAYLRANDIPVSPAIIAWDVIGTQVSFIGDPTVLDRIRKDRARVISSTVRNGAIVEAIATNCWCPNDMLEHGSHLSTCKDQF